MNIARSTILGISMVLVAVAGASVVSAPKLNPEGYTSSATCGKCHTAIYDKWRHSMHAMSASDPIFQFAYNEAVLRTRGEAREFCLKCHAPTVVHTGDLAMEQSITKEGVTCDFCHTVTSAKPGHRSKPFEVKPGLVKMGSVAQAASPAHETERSLLHTKAEFCGSCHEMKGRNGVTIMGTYSEWRSGPYAKRGITCQKCHMPVTSTRTVRSGIKGTSHPANLHDLQGGHSIPAVQKAAKVKITSLKRNGDLVKGVVSVTNVGSGHMIPTGVPSRKLVLHIEARLDGGGRAYNRKVELQKVMGDKNGRELQNDVDIMLNSARVLSDNRIPPGQTKEFGFSFPLSRFHPVAVQTELTYCYKPAGLQPEGMVIRMDGDKRRLK